MLRLPRARAVSAAALAALGLAVAACAPSLGNACGGDDDCARGEVCAAGSCRTSPAPGDGGSHGAGGFDSDGSSDAGTGDLDARITGGDRDPLSPSDSGPAGDAPLPDAAPPVCPLPMGALVPPEICNGYDDDCDGPVDEGDAPGTPIVRVCYSGSAESRGVGACHDGVETCTDGRWPGCAREQTPVNETCDALDNDCDLVVDEGAEGGPLTRACYSGAAGTAGVGPCAFGAQVCLEGILGPCMGEVRPGVEICDGADNDCNAETDDVAHSEVCGACEAQTSRPCYHGPEGTAGVGLCLAGVQRCAEDGSGWGACEGVTVPQAESCNGEDDDCNGEADDGIEGTGADCNHGVGACAAVGTVTCDAGRIDCTGPELAPIDERCNAVDDDCDGVADEDFAVGRPCQSGVGACAAEGVTVCANDNVMCGAATPGAGTEDCNHLDDDCDGHVDEGQAGELLERTCYEGPEGTSGRGPCHSGRQVCFDALWSSCVDQTLPYAELCDGTDNDCDGSADEGLSDACACVGDERRECYTGGPGTSGVGRCVSGEQRCVSGSFGACVGETLPGPEVCNGLDDDCNGQPDDVLGLDQACAVGRGSCARMGAFRCDAAQREIVCDAVAGGAAREACNGLDDNCDGAIDDGFDVGSVCTFGVGACARPGWLVCGPEFDTRCDGVAGMPSLERCDGVDNDCDGNTDVGAAAQCPARPQATASCEQGECRYTCVARAADADADLRNGCEHICGPVTTGIFLTGLTATGNDTHYPGQLSIALDGFGSAGVAYVNYERGTQRSALVLATHRGDQITEVGGAGFYAWPLLVSSADAWAVFGIQTGGANGSLLDAVRVVYDGDDDGDPSFSKVSWPLTSAVIPGVAALTVGGARMAVAYTAEVAEADARTGVLRTRVFSIDDAAMLSDGIIDATSDYRATGVRYLTFAQADGTVAIAPIERANENGRGRLRALLVDYQGHILGQAETPDAFNSPSPLLAGAFSGASGVVALAEAPDNLLKLWSLSVNAVGGPIFASIQGPAIGGVESLAVVFGRGGPIVLYLQGGAVRALFLDQRGQPLGAPLEVVTAPAPDETVGQFVATSNGNRIAVAFVTRAADGDRLHTATLDCR